MIQSYTVEDVVSLLHEHYGLEGKLKELGSYADRNFLLKTEASTQGSTKYLVKISLQAQDDRLLLLQNAVFKQLSLNKHDFQCRFPEILPTKKAEDMVVLTSQKGKEFLRVLSFIEGQQMYYLEDPPLHLFDQAGQITAKLSLFLGKLSAKKQIVDLYTSAKTEKHPFNLLKFNEDYQQNYKFLDVSIASIVDRVKQEYNEVLPILQGLPKQLVHHDICQTNVIVAKHPQTGEYYISGIIDFSDVFETHGILELVVLAARINLHKLQPLRNALRVIAAFNRVKQLTGEERRLLFPLIKARLATLTMGLARQAAEKADDEYIERCKTGIFSYLVTIADACTNSEFEAMLEQEILKS